MSDLGSADVRLAWAEVTVESHVANGMFCDVFCGHVASDKKVSIAIKLPRERRELLGSTKLQEAVKDVQTEISVLAQMMPHDNVVRMLGHGVAVPRDVPFVLLSLLDSTLKAELPGARESTSVWARRSAVKRWPIDRACRLGVQVAEALDHLHHHAIPSARVLHRDLKPANLGLTRASDSHPERIVLLDFGLATVYELSESDADASERRRLTACTGSQRYMAPEVMRGEPYTHKCDNYSWAVVLWQMLAHDAPFEELSGLDEVTYADRIGVGHVRPKLRPAWPVELRDIISDCWDSDPAARPEMGRVADELSRLLASEVLLEFPGTSRTARASSRGFTSAVGVKLRGFFRPQTQTGAASPVDDDGDHSPRDRAPSTSSSSAGAEGSSRAPTPSDMTTSHVATVGAPQASGSGTRCIAVPAVAMSLLEDMADEAAAAATP